MLIYEPKDTAIHQLHPLTKLVGLAVVCAVAITFSHPVFICALGIPVVGLVFAARSFAAVRRVWKLMVILFLFSSVMWTFLMAGDDALISVGPLSIRRGPFFYGVAMGLRFNVMLLAGVVFAATTRVEDFTAALCMVGLPYRVSFALSLAFRLVPTFMETAVTIAQAQRCRGLDLDSGGFAARARKYIPLIVPVFMMAVRSADNLAMALESKGFGAARRRVSYEQYAFTMADVVVLVLCVAILVGSIVARVAGFGGV